MRQFKNYSITTMVIVLLIVLTTCQSGKTQQDDFIVQHKGVLREIMIMGELHARADLMEYAQKPNLVGLGALEDLAGEIFIQDGQVLISKVKEGQLSLETRMDHKAALLVSSEIDSWKAKKSTANLNSIEELQSFIKSQINTKTNSPFPFKLKGTVKSLNWHIINGPEATEKNHDAYKEAGLEGVIEEEPIEILGFYSEEHEGIFTHHGSYLHMHFKNEQETIMGHVDNISWLGEIELSVPKSIMP